MHILHIDGRRRSELVHTLHIDGSVTRLRGGGLDEDSVGRAGRVFVSNVRTGVIRGVTDGGSRGYRRRDREAARQTATHEFYDLHTRARVTRAT